MSSALIEELSDLYRIPDADLSFKKDFFYQLTIGDLHGNAIKLLFMLIKHGIAKNITTLDYELLVAIYNTPPEKIQNYHIDFFEQKMANMQCHFNGIIRLIGDELADRGSNDYFMLKLFQSLAKANIIVEILLSNHGAEFNEASEIRKKYSVSMMRKDLVKSMLNLQYFIASKLVNDKEIDRILNHIYKPKIKIISYSISPTKSEITIYSHAPIGLNTVKALANHFKITYQDSSAVKLALTLELINYKFQKKFRKKLLHKLYEDGVMYQGYCGEPIDQNKHPLEFVMWNRIHDSSLIDRPNWNNDYRLNFVHGHDHSTLDYGNIYNLDNDFGKGLDHNQGLYTVLVSQELPLSLQELKLLAHLKVLKKVAMAIPSIGSIPTLASTLYAEVRQNVKHYLAKRINMQMLENSCSETIAKIETQKSIADNTNYWGPRLFGRRKVRINKQLEQLQKEMNYLSRTLMLDNSDSFSATLSV